MYLSMPDAAKNGNGDNALLPWLTEKVFLESQNSVLVSELFWQDEFSIHGQSEGYKSRLLTKCVTMQEADPRMRPLQNHLPEVTHFTTDAGAWMPQYLQGRRYCYKSQNLPLQ